MSQVFHGVIVKCPEPEIRVLFAKLDAKVPLLLVRLDEGVFGIYARRGPNAVDELRRLAGPLSSAVGAALFYWYDSRVADWFQLFEHGQMTREILPDVPPKKTWGKGDPLEAIGASPSLHKVVEEAFLYNILEPLAEHDPLARWAKKWQS